MDQYRFDREPRPKGQGSAEPLLSFPNGALVHFAVSQMEARMTTKLEGPSTTFLPFNRGNHGGAGNPPYSPSPQPLVCLTTTVKPSFIRIGFLIKMMW